MLCCTIIHMWCLVDVCMSIHVILFSMWNNYNIKFPFPLDTIQQVIVRVVWSLLGKYLKYTSWNVTKKSRAFLCTFNCRFEQSEMDRWHLSNHPQVRCTWCYGSSNWIFGIKVQAMQGRDDVYDSSFLFLFFWCDYIIM